MQGKATDIKGIYLKCLFVMCLFCPVFVLGEYSYVFGHRYLPICLLPATLVGLLMIPRDDWGERWKLLKQFWLPFIPWVISLLIVYTLQGRYRGVHNYGYMLGVFGLLYFVFCREEIAKKSIPWAVSVSLCWVFGIVLVAVAKYGLQAAPGELEVGQNRLMGVALVLTVVCFALGFQTKDILLRSVLWISTALGVAAIAICQVRCCLLGLGALVFVVYWSVGKRFRILGVAGLAAVLGMAVFYFLYTGRLSTGFNDLERWVRGDVNSSWGIRLEIWKATLCGMQFHPWIGWGESPLRGIFATGGCSTPLWGIYDLGTHMHNDFLYALGRGGIVGALGWLTMQISLFVVAKGSVARRCMLIGIWLGGVGEIYWPYCMYVAYTFVYLWFLLLLYERPRTCSN